MSFPRRRLATKLLVALTFSVLIGVPAVSAQSVVTVAGTGIAGYNGEALLASATTLNNPKGIAFDSTGNIYVADNSNHRVRRISANGSVATIAGTGVAGFSGDGGPATEAMLNQPVSVAVDAAGNVIIGDTQNRRIRRINAGTGIISTIAGTGTEGNSGDFGPATSAMIRLPIDLAVDFAGNIYFADSVANRIRKISTTGIITTVAGTGVAGSAGDNGPAALAQLDVPSSIAVDASANSLYIADARNHRIRRVGLNDGIIVNVAGNGAGSGTDTGSFSGDGGLAVTAGLNTPEGVALDLFGNLYIADMENYRVRKVNLATGVITTVGGTGADGFSGDGGVATQARFNLPWSVAVNRSGNVYVADLLNQRIRKLIVNTEPATYSFAHFAIGGGWQTTLTFTNYSPQAITCQTAFYADDGGPFLAPFNGVFVATRTDDLAPGGTLHSETNASVAAATTSGWAQSQCTGPVKASVLFRFYQNGVAAGEAGVNGMSAPATKFVSFAETKTGVAYSNPSNLPATVTLSVFDTSGVRLATKVTSLLPRGHGAQNLGQFFGLSSFTGSVQVVSTVPIVSLSINAEVFPSISSLPPGEVDDSTVFSAGVSVPQTGTPVIANMYLFSHLAFGNGWQTTLTYINYSPKDVTCQTSFFSNTGGALSVPFPGGGLSSRVDAIRGGGSIHVETSASPTLTDGGWAQVQCTGPIKASTLFRFYDQGVAKSEAGVNGMLGAAVKFATFAETGTGIAYANPSPQTAQVTVTAVAASGARLGSSTFALAPGEHGALYVGSLLGLGSFAGSIQITSTVPIISLSLNGEALPSISSLPPGELDPFTPLASN